MSTTSSSSPTTARNGASQRYYDPGSSTSPTSKNCAVASRLSRTLTAAPTGTKGSLTFKEKLLSLLGGKPEADAVSTNDTGTAPLDNAERRLNLEEKCILDIASAFEVALLVGGGSSSKGFSTSHSMMSLLLPKCDKTYSASQLQWQCESMCQLLGPDHIEMFLSTVCKPPEDDAANKSAQNLSQQERQVREGSLQSICPHISAQLRLNCLRIANYDVQLVADFLLTSGEKAKTNGSLSPAAETEIESEFLRMFFERESREEAKVSAKQRKAPQIDIGILAKCLEKVKASTSPISCVRRVFPSLFWLLHRSKSSNPYIDVIRLQRRTMEVLMEVRGSANLEIEVRLSKLNEETRGDFQHVVIKGDSLDYAKNIPPHKLIKVLVLGNSGRGKSYLINTMCGKQVFHHKTQSASCTRDVSGVVVQAPSLFGDDTYFALFDIPGLIEADAAKVEDNRVKIRQAIEMFPGSSTAVVLVFGAGAGGRFSEEDTQCFLALEKSMGFDPAHVTVVVNNEPEHADADSEYDFRLDWFRFAQRTIKTTQHPHFVPYVHSQKVRNDYFHPTTLEIARRMIIATHEAVRNRQPVAFKAEIELERHKLEKEIKQRAEDAARHHRERQDLLKQNQAKQAEMEAAQAELERERQKEKEDFEASLAAQKRETENVRGQLNAAQNQGSRRGGCIAADSLVTTVKGPLQMSEVGEDLAVLQCDTCWDQQERKPATADKFKTSCTPLVLNRPGALREALVVCVSTRSGRCVRLTPHHHLPVARGGSMMKLPAGDVRSGDCLLVQPEQQCQQGHSMTTLEEDPVTSVEQSFTQVRFFVSSSDEAGIFVDGILVLPTTTSHEKYKGWCKLARCTPKFLLKKVAVEKYFM